MKITAKNAAIVMDFDLAGIIHHAQVVKDAANDRGPGHIKAIKDAARHVVEFAQSLANSQADVVRLVPDAPALPGPGDWTPAVTREAHAPVPEMQGVRLSKTVTPKLTTF